MNQTHSPNAVSAPGRVRENMLESLRQPPEDLAIGRTLRRELEHWIETARFPLSKADCDREFRRMCRPAHRSEYAKGYRYQLVQRFNRWLDYWYSQGWIPERYQIKNYQRTRLFSLLDVPVFFRLPPTALELLVQQFVSDLTSLQGTQKDQWSMAFWHFAFAFIRFGGGAWPTVFSDLARLEWRHLQSAPDGYLLLPRDGIQMRLYVPPIVQLCALLLGENLPHSPGRPFPCESQVILPQAHGANAEQVTPKNVQSQHRRLERWLRDLSRKAGLPRLTKEQPAISIQTFAQACASPLLQIYSPMIAGAILGTIAYSPVPADQVDVFESYVSPKPDRHSGKLVSLPREPQVSPQMFAEAEDQYSEPEDLDLWIQQFHKACRPLFDHRTAQRKKTAENLTALARAMLSSVGIAKSEDVRRKFAEVAQTDAVPAQVFNLSAAALFLARQCENRGLRVNTLAAQRSDLAEALRWSSDLRFDSWDEEDLQELFASRRADASRRRLASTCKALHIYLKSELGLTTTTILWRKLRIARERDHVRLPSQGELEQLFADLRYRAKADSMSERANRSRNAYLAALLATYFGLRLRETVRLTLGDLFLNSQSPFLAVRRSKRGRSRRVYAVQVPDTILRELIQERRRRFLSTRDLAAPFLANGDGGETEPHAIRSAVTESFERIGLRDNTVGQPIVFHTLRHVFANRLLLTRVPLITIANLLGHASPETTTSSYLHCFDYLQRQQLETNLRKEQDTLELTATTLGAWMGVKRTTMLGLIKRYEKASGTRIKKRKVKQVRLAVTEGRSDQDLITLGDAVRVLAFHLELQNRPVPGS